MRRKQQRRGWIVRRKYEPSRLSQVILEQAYTKIASHYIRVLRVPIGEVGGSHEMGQQPQECVVR